MSIIKRLSSVQQWWQIKKLPNGLNRQSDRPHFGIPPQQLPDFVQRSATAMRHYQWLRVFNWDQFPERDLVTRHPHQPTPYSVFTAAYLIKIQQGFVYMTQLHQYLHDHPALSWLLGFHLVAGSSSAWDFSPQTSLPTARHFSRLLRKMPNDCAQFLLDETVRLLQVELTRESPDFGQSISLDTKHILAWVKENNPNTWMSDRFNKAKQPKGDRDCKIGYKSRKNQPPSSENVPKTPKTNPKPASKSDVGSFYWGYASGVVATKVPGWGEFVLAELTQPFNQPDVSYFEPLMKKVTQRLRFKPLFGAFDAAFDAFYVYEYFHREGQPWQEGFAAVPFIRRSARRYAFDEAGNLLCEGGLTMVKQRTYMNKTSRVPHERAVWRCPLHEGGHRCPIQHPKWQKEGCTHRVATSVGVQIRHTIDRDSPTYKRIYDQRTATERINAQAKELGIERPHLRNQQSITNHNSLIYVVINLRAFHRIKQNTAAIEGRVLAV